MAVNKNTWYYVASHQFIPVLNFNNLNQAKTAGTEVALPIMIRSWKIHISCMNPAESHLVNHLCEDSQKLYPICCFIFAKIANLVFTLLSDYLPSPWTLSVHLLLFPIGTIYLFFKGLSSFLKGISLCI